QAFRERIERDTTQQTKRWEQSISDKLDELLRCPPYHSRHIEKLRDFYVGPRKRTASSNVESGYEASVFVMTKYPEGNSKADIRLRSVIRAVVGAIEGRGYSARLASDDEYHK